MGYTHREMVVCPSMGTYTTLLLLCGAVIASATTYAPTTLAPTNVPSYAPTNSPTSHATNSPTSHAPTKSPAQLANDVATAQTLVAASQDAFVVAQTQAAQSQEAFVVAQQAFAVAQTQGNTDQTQAAQVALMQAQDQATSALEQVAALKADLDNYTSLLAQAQAALAAAGTSSPSYSPSWAPSKSPTGSGSGSGSGSNPGLAPTREPTKSPSWAPSNAPTLAPTLVPSNSPTFAPTVGPTITGDTAHPTPGPTAPTKVVVRQRVVIAGASNMDETDLKASIATIVTNNAQQSGMNVESVFVTIEGIDSSLLQTSSGAHRVVGLSAAVVAERVPEDLVIPEKKVSPTLLQVRSSGISYSAVVRTDTAASASELNQLGTAMDSTTSSSTLCSSVPGCTGVMVAVSATMAVVTVAPSAAPTGTNNSSNDDV